MAETTAPVEGESSPIMSLAQDQLFTVLLRLPLDSILSFAMTCKRFRMLVCSDMLWESLCRREWGNSIVDSLKSDGSGQSFGDDRRARRWKELFKQVRNLESVSCRAISGPADGDLGIPCPRASHSLNFVSDCLVLFGGGCEGGRHLDDTWVAYIGGNNHYSQTIKWKKVDSGNPSGRFGHTCVAIGSHRLVLFGGINDRGDRRNDTWIGEITFRENLISWKLLDVAGSVAPAPRGAHAACCIVGEKMVIHGGIGLHGVRLGDTWVLEFSDDFRFGKWHQVVFQPSPPPRSGHTLTGVRQNQAVLFGGRGLGYDVLNDVWILEVSNNQEKWVHMLYNFPNTPERASLPRVGHSATLILGEWLLIYGGEDSYRHRKEDFWVLDVKAIPETPLQPHSLSLKGLSAWRRINSTGYRPQCRSFHRACVDPSGRYVYMFGGMVDGLVHPASSSELRFDGELFIVELALHL